MRIAITGASGFVGTRATKFFRDRGDEVVALHRRKGGTEIGTEEVGAADAVLHLAGENVAAGRWTARKKRAIAESRGPLTEQLCRALAGLERKPAVLVSASAIGIYGDRGDEHLDETSAPGTGFLADVAQAWEAGTAPATAAGIRVVNLRIGLVLDPDGGALKKMLLPFKLGVGGRLGSGRQWMSWIALDDLVRAIAFAIDKAELNGPVLAVGPDPVTNRDFTTALGKALGRPTILPAPAFALRLALGEMADALLLGSQRAVPARLLEAGFEFGHSEVGPTLQTML